MSPKLYIVCETIRSAYNVGSIFRSADSAGVSKLFLCGYTAIPPHPKVAKTALGSSNTVEWEHHCDPIRLLTMLKNQGIRLVAAEPGDAATNIFTSSFTTDTAIIVGHEESGVSDKAIELADEQVFIPHQGLKESLNVAVATGVIVYEYMRKITPNWQ